MKNTHFLWVQPLIHTKYEANCMTPIRETCLVKLFIHNPYYHHPPFLKLFVGETLKKSTFNIMNKTFSLYKKVEGL